MLSFLGPLLSQLGIWTKIKIILGGIVAALLPVLYLFGRRTGSQIEKNKELKRALRSEKKKAELYKKLEQKSNEIENSAPRNRDELSKRLREHGL